MIIRKIKESKSLTDYEFRKKHGLKIKSNYKSVIKKRRKKKKKYIYNWKKIREEILKRDNNCCVECGSKKYLQVHHKSYQHVGSKKEMKDCITVCGNCHQIIHGLIDSLYDSR